MRYKVEQNFAPHPPEQKWRVWMVDEHGDEWTMFFAPTKVKAEKWAARHRGRDVVHSRAASRSLNRLVREHLGLAVPPGVRDIDHALAKFRAALEEAFKAGYRMARRALRPRKH